MKKTAHMAGFLFIFILALLSLLATWITEMSIPKDIDCFTCRYVTERVLCDDSMLISLWRGLLASSKGCRKHLSTVLHTSKKKQVLKKRSAFFKNAMVLRYMESTITITLGLSAKVICR